MFGEHLVLVLLTLPFLFGAIASMLRLGWRHVLAAAVIGAGSSALATILFTQALVDGHDYVTPVVIQKVQPVIAVLAAGVILGERPTRALRVLLRARARRHLADGRAASVRPDRARASKPMLYALGAAVLWALGTVLGRYLSRDMRFEHVTTLRFAFGLPASALALLVLGAPAFASGHDTFWIAVLAVVTGFVALGLYYYGLQSTPAVVGDARRARVPGERDPRRLLQVRPDADRLAVGRRRVDDGRRRAAAGGPSRRSSTCRPRLPRRCLTSRRARLRRTRSRRRASR